MRRLVLLFMLLFSLTGCGIIETIALPTDESIEVFTYRVDYLDNQGEPLARSRVGSGSAGAEVVEYPIMIAGYTPRENQLHALVPEHKTLVLKFYYDKEDSPLTEATTKTPANESSSNWWGAILFILGLTFLLLAVFLRIGRRS